MTLFKKNTDLNQSFVYGGYLIIKQIKKSKDGKISFCKACEVLHKNGIVNYRQQFFCLMFLYTCDIIEFKEPYIEIKNAN